MDAHEYDALASEISQLRALVDDLSGEVLQLREELELARFEAEKSDPYAVNPYWVDDRITDRAVGELVKQKAAKPGLPSRAGKGKSATDVLDSMRNQQKQQKAQSQNYWIQTLAEQSLLSRASPDEMLKMFTDAHKGPKRRVK